MEGDEISVLLLAPHLLHCPVSFLVLTMRRVLNTFYCHNQKFASFCSCSWTCTHICVYLVPGCAGVMHLPPAFYSAMFCSGEDASIVLAELEQEMARSGLETLAKVKRSNAL